MSEEQQQGQRITLGDGSAQAKDDASYFGTWALDIVRMGRHFLPDHASHELVHENPGTPGPTWKFACSCGAHLEVAQIQLEQAYYEADAVGEEAVKALLFATGPAR